MEKKIVLIVLIVIAVVAFMFLGAGLFRGSRDPEVTARSYKPEGSFMETLDNLFARSRKPFDRSRMAVRPDGCALQDSVLTFTTQCYVEIKPGSTKSSAFYLKKGSSLAAACYAFDTEALTKCLKNDRNALDKESHRFVVTQDGALMQLQCLNPTAGCRITVANRN